MEYLSGTGNLLGARGFVPWGQSGAGGAGGNGGASGAEGHGGAAVQPTVMPPPGMTTVGDAINELEGRYNQLGRYMARIEGLYGLLDLGNRAPCEIVDAYNDMVRAYTGAAMQVFEQIQAAEPNAEITQTTYDKNGQVVARKLGAVPIMPPGINQAQCGAAPLLRADGTMAGYTQLGAIQLAGVVIVIAVAAIVGTTGIIITNLIINRPEASFEKMETDAARLDALMSCTERRAEALRKMGKAFTLKDLDTYCNKQVPAPIPIDPREKAKDADTNWLLWTGIGAGTVIGMFFLFRALTKDRY